MKRFIVPAALLVLAGCSQLGAMYEGATGGDVDPAYATWGKIGSMLMPVLSQLLGILRGELFPIIGL